MRAQPGTGPRPQFPRCVAASDLLSQAGRPGPSSSSPLQATNGLIAAPNRSGGAEAAPAGGGPRRLAAGRGRGGGGACRLAAFPPRLARGCSVGPTVPGKGRLSAPAGSEFWSLRLSAGIRREGEERGPGASPGTSQTRTRVRPTACAHRPGPLLLVERRAGRP